MSYLESERIRRIKRKNRRKEFAAWFIVWFVILSTVVVAVSGIVHLLYCTNTVEAATETKLTNVVVEEPESEPEPKSTSLGEFKLTAYCACFKCCGKHPDDAAYGITKSGVRAVEGVTVAADPKVIPLGTEIIIDGYGEYTVQDTGGAIKGKRIDVYFEDHQEALEFGVQYKEVFINVRS
jgi:3D (Asp-Asp-Asp) domain-containing protein